MEEQGDTTPLGPWTLLCSSVCLGTCCHVLSPLLLLCPGRGDSILLHSCLPWWDRPRSSCRIQDLALEPGNAALVPRPCELRMVIPHLLCVGAHTCTQMHLPLMPEHQTQKALTLQPHALKSVVFLCPGHVNFPKCARIGGETDCSLLGPPDHEAY